MEIILMENNRIKSTFLKDRNGILRMNANETKVFLSALISIILIISFGFLFYYYYSVSEIIKQGGFWTLLSLIVSSPVAFVIWSFRDKNATDQINNSRKDTNLKEYHKIVEWITNKDSSEDLKISAIYSLRRFYEDQSLGFQQAALHLLLSTWESMQKNELEKLKTVDDSKEAESIINSLRKNGNSPLGRAITRVLLSNEGKYLLAYTEIFSSICLSGMNFYLPGLSDNIVKKIFNKKEIKYSGMQLQGCKFKWGMFDDVDCSNSNFLGTEWVGVWNVNRKSDDVIKFIKCDFRYSEFKGISFEKCDFSHSNFMGAKFDSVIFNKSAIFNGGNFLYSKIFFYKPPESENFLGSIIFKSDFSKWSYREIDKNKKGNYTLQKIKDLGMFVIYEGNKKYKSCRFKINKNNDSNSFEYSLKNIRISDNDTISNNSNWNVSKT